MQRQQANVNVKYPEIEVLDKHRVSPELGNSTHYVTGESTKNKSTAISDEKSRFVYFIYLSNMIMVDITILREQ